MTFTKECAKNDLLGTKHKSLVKLQYIQQNPPETLPKDTPAQFESKPFETTKQDLRYSNLSKEECRAINSVADDRSIVIKKADKDSCDVVWDRNGYVLEAKKHFGDLIIY